MNRKEFGILYPIFFLFALPVILHFLLSRFGFNPTDDGFTLGYSRRILDGQIPHRDFIIIRPFLSPLLHIPELILTKEYSYLLSRFFVWVQISWISFFWVLTLNNLSGKILSNLEKFVFTAITLMLTLHTFPLTAWHTIDGLFFVIIGIYLCTHLNTNSKTIGYSLTGLSYLCKQSFIFAPLLLLVLLKNLKKIQYWVASILPGLGYVLFLYLTGSLSDAFTQLSSQKDIFHAGFIRYLHPVLIIGFLIGFTFTYVYFFNFRFKPQHHYLINLLFNPYLLSLLPLLWLIAAIVVDSRYGFASFGTFGLIIGIVASKMLNSRCFLSDKICVSGLLSLTPAWCSSISVGYNYPMLASGLMVAFLLVHIKVLMINKIKSRTNTLLIVSMGIVTMVSFVYARWFHIYRDQPISQLTQELGDVLPGGKGIVTNSTTYAFMHNLDEAIKKVDTCQYRFSIVPDCAGYWARSKQANLLSIDWPQTTELSTEQLISRIYNEINLKKDSLVFIVQKYQARDLHQGLIPLAVNDYPVVKYIKQRCTKIDENNYFELYH